VNDNEVLAAVRDAFSDVRMRTPLEQAMRRGRVMRARRRGYRVAALAGAAAVAAVAAVNLGTAPSNTVALAAWTVTVRPDHTVTVTVRQMTDAAGLQRQLRNDGIPARVAFQAGIASTTPPLPAGCRMAEMSTDANIGLQAKILGAAQPGSGAGQVALALSPRAIPHGIGIYLAIQSGSSPDSGWGWGLDLVQATRSCTG
jgi:hypothetical protein